MIEVLGFQIHIYGLLIGLAILAAWEIALREGKKNNIGEEVINKSAWWMIVGGIIGARLYHVVDFWNRYYINQPIKILYLWEGGLAIWGALIGGAIGLLMYWKLFYKSDKLYRVNILSVIDSVITGVPLAQAIGRLGNWVNKELYGKNNLPLFAIEAALNLILFSILYWGMKKTKPGMQVSIYLIGYGIIRVCLENLRPDELIFRFGSIPVAVLFGLFSVLIGVSLIYFRRRH